MHASCFRPAILSGIIAVSAAISDWPPAIVSAAAPESESPPLLDGLGKHRRKITTGSADSQRYFDQGLNLLYAFNHDEAIRSFRHAAALDGDCAMAYWGVALANGPHINNPAVPPDRAAAAWAALRQAQAHAQSCSEAERALITALAARYADPQPEDRRPLDEAYAAAMKEVWKKFPNDDDVGALYAEALMDLRPWDLWTADGKPQPETPEIVAVLEAVLKLNPDHPLGTHLYIHAVEASPAPEKADDAAEHLRHLAPGLGHLVHMPSHIDVRRGRWREAVAANQRAVAADAKYRATVPEQGFYRIYMAHNHHMLAFAATMHGRSRAAAEAVDRMLREIPQDWLADGVNAAIVDGLFAMPIELQMRFGRWDDVLAAPEPEARFPVARAMRHFARGVAYAALKRPDEARRSQRAFRDAVGAVPEGARVGNNTAADVLAVAESMLEGEILLSEEKTAEAIGPLRAAVAKEDALRYDEPPDWFQPVRHALGAALLKAGRPAEAEQTYRDDLRRWPENGWSLFGLVEALTAQGKTHEAAEARRRFDDVWRDADVKLTASCYCLSK